MFDLQSLVSFATRNSGDDTEGETLPVKPFGKISAGLMVIFSLILIGGIVLIFGAIENIGIVNGVVMKSSPIPQWGVPAGIAVVLASLVGIVVILIINKE